MDVPGSSMLPLISYGANSRAELNYQFGNNKNVKVIQLIVSYCHRRKDTGSVVENNGVFRSIKSGHLTFEKKICYIVILQCGF